MNSSMVTDEPSSASRFILIGHSSVSLQNPDGLKNDMYLHELPSLQRWLHSVFVTTSAKIATPPQNALPGVVTAEMHL